VDTPTRILYVIINLEVGGTEKQLVELVRGLDPVKFEPHVCCLRGGGPLVAEMERMGIPLTLFRFPPLDYSMKLEATRNFAFQVGEISALMRKVKPVIVQGLLPMAFVSAGIAAKLARVPLLITSRRSLGCYKEKRFLLRQLENMVNLWTDLVVANSEAVRADTVSRERVNPVKVRIVYNGVKVPARRGRVSLSRLVGRNVDGPTVCLPANFFPYKGHSDFIQAAGIVAKEVPEAMFLLAGDGMLRSRIEAEINDLRLADRFILTGLRHDMEKIMAGVDLVALTSIEEGFPNVVLEAMAAGKPVVATRVGGVPEAVEDGKTGLLVAPRNPESLGRALVRLLKNKSEAESMGRAARERVKARFTISRMVRSYEGIYSELLRKAGR
jgi:glycosyltransferase involved in cell wall biosynthesis